MDDPTDRWIVPGHLLDELASEAPVPPAPTKPTYSSNGKHDSKLMVDKWLDARGLAFRVKSEPDTHGRRVFVLKNCPFDSSHADPDACVMQAPDGRLSAKCFHNSCQGHGWQDFKTKIGPPSADHYDPPLKPARARMTGTAPAQEAETDKCPAAIVIDPIVVPVSETMGRITDVFIAAKNCYRRAGDFTRVVDDVCIGVTTAAELAGV